MNAVAVPGLGDMVGTTGELGLDLATTAVPNLVLAATEMETVSDLLNTGAAPSRIDLVDKEGTAETVRDETVRPTGAVPSLEERRDTICQTILSGVENVPSTEGLTGTGSDSNGRTMPNRNPEMPNRKVRMMKKNRNEGYNLNYWSLWWRRMEREGVKEGADRRVLSM